MAQVRHILTDLFRPALTEHGREAPALTDIIIERASGRFEPLLVAQFSNGHRTSTPVRAVQFYTFCDRYSAWGLDSLCSALLREGQEIYAQMVENRAPEMRIRGRRHAITVHSDAHIVLRLRGHEFPRDNARRTLRDWWNRQWSPRERSIRGPNTDPEAHARGTCLLTQNLSPTQRDQYEKRGDFDVIGGTTGNRYRIKRALQLNIEELDKNGNQVRLLCFMPEGGLVVGDVMLAQKLALELFEPHALRIANTFHSRNSRFFTTL